MIFALLSHKCLYFKPIFVRMKKEICANMQKTERKSNMGNPLYNDFKKMKISREIAERESMVLNYNRTGNLDRETAKNLIRKLKRTDIEVKTVSSLKEIQCGTIDLNSASNDTLIFNLQMQVDILEAKLAKLASEEIK